jgi:hypothetical protein
LLWDLSDVGKVLDIIPQFVFQRMSDPTGELNVAELERD